MKEELCYKNLLKSSQSRIICQLCAIFRKNGDYFQKNYIKVKKIIKKWKEKDACGDGIGVRLPIEREGWEATCLVIGGNS